MEWWSDIITFPKIPISRNPEIPQFQSSKIPEIQNSFLGRSGSAVGLSAISFSAALQKDAAPIPNALGRTLELKKNALYGRGLPRPYS